MKKGRSAAGCGADPPVPAEGGELRRSAVERAAGRRSQRSSGGLGWITGIFSKGTAGRWEGLPGEAGVQISAPGGAQESGDEFT